MGRKQLERAEKVSLPFFDGVPIYDVALFFWRSIVDGSITTRASAIAFSFFIALFPAIIFLFTLIPYIPIENFQTDLYLIIQQLVPQSTFDTIEETISEIVLQQRGGLLSLGFFMALIFSTNGLASMMSAFDATIHSINRRSWVSQRLAAILLLFILAALLTLAMALLTGGQLLIDYITEHHILQDNFTIFLLDCWEVGRYHISCFSLHIHFCITWLRQKKQNGGLFQQVEHLATVLSIIALIGIFILHQQFQPIQ